MCIYKRIYVYERERGRANQPDNDITPQHISREEMNHLWRHQSSVVVVINIIKQGGWGQAGFGNRRRPLPPPCRHLLAASAAGAKEQMAAQCSGGGVCPACLAALIPILGQHPFEINGQKIGACMHAYAWRIWRHWFWDQINGNTIWYAVLSPIYVVS